MPNSSPSWAQADIPAGISSDNLAIQEQTEALKDQWRRERGLIGENLEFASTGRGELWLRWRDRWLLLINKSRPGEFLAPSTLQRYYSADITKALGIHDDTRLSRQARESLQEAGQELGEQEAAIAGQSLELQDLGEAAKVASDAIQMMETAMNTELMGEDLPYPAGEIRGLVKALQTSRGELMNNLARLTEIDERGRAVDKDIAEEQRKLDEADERGSVNEETRRKIAERLRKLKEERASIRMIEPLALRLLQLTERTSAPRSAASGRQSARS